MRDAWLMHAGPGRFPLALATKLPAYNVLGIDIRGKVSNNSTPYIAFYTCMLNPHCLSIHFLVCTALCYLCDNKCKSC